MELRRESGWTGRDGSVRQLPDRPARPVDDAVDDLDLAEFARPQELDRAAVAEIVFSDKAQLAALNAIVHPAVTDEMTRRRQAWANTDATVVLDIPLLIETNYSDLDAVVVVDVDPEIAVRRLVEQRGFTETDARARVASQASRADRRGTDGTVSVGRRFDAPRGGQSEDSSILHKLWCSHG